MQNFWTKLIKPITVLAPMDDVTDNVFRELISRIAKPDVLFTEFTSADAICSSGREKVAHKLTYTEIQRPIVAQIWGSNSNTFEKAALYIAEKGFDGIDINMGCPERAIMKRNSGAALVNNMELVSQLVNAIRKAAPKLPLSIKTRLAPTPKLTGEWLSFLLSLDISTLTLHARSAKDLSKVPANWDEIEKAVVLKNKLNPQVVLIGNGDVRSYKEIVEKQREYGVDGVMVGRGIFHNPWLFDKKIEIVEHTSQEYLKLLKEHSKLFNETWGKTKNFEILKKFFKVYIKDFRGASDLRQKLMNTKSYEEFCNVFGDFNL